MVDDKSAVRAAFQIRITERSTKSTWTSVPIMMTKDEASGLATSGLGDEASTTLMIETPTGYVSVRRDDVLLLELLAVGMEDR